MPHRSRYLPSNAYKRVERIQLSSSSLFLISLIYSSVACSTFGAPGADRPQGYGFTLTHGLVPCVTGMGLTFRAALVRTPQPTVRRFSTSRIRGSNKVTFRYVLIVKELSLCELQCVWMNNHSLQTSYFYDGVVYTPPSLSTRIRSQIPGLFLHCNGNSEIVLL